MQQKEKIFEAYYVKYYPQVYGYIFKKLLNEANAEDMTMDVFYSVWDKFDTFDEEKASFQTWLFVIVNNKLKNHYRDCKEGVELDETLVSDDDPEEDVVQAIQMQYLRDHLYQAMEALNETQQKIVIYKYFKNLNGNEIADLMGLSPGNVRITLKRALEKIRVYFETNQIRWE